LLLLPHEHDEYSLPKIGEKGGCNEGDVLELRQVKNAYGKKADPIRLLRSSNGVLQRFTPDEMDYRVQFEDMLLRHYDFFIRNGNQPFSRSSITRGDRGLKKIWPKRINTKKANEYFSFQIESGNILPAERIKSGAGYIFSGQVTSLANKKSIFSDDLDPFD